MKITFELDDGYERVFEVDEDEISNIADMGTTKEMLQARIDELEEANRDKAGDICFYHEANKACQKEIEKLRDEKKSLESKLRDAIGTAEAWEARCGELEQENRELRKKLEEAQDRIHEQDLTIAKYDDENRTIKNTLNVAMDVPLHALNCWARRIHGIAVSHGWWETEDGKCDDGDRPFAEIAMMCVTEIAEAVEEYRNGKPLAYQVQSYGIVEGRVEEDPDKWFPATKPEGVAVEMIDCIIRILDWCGHAGVDVDKLIDKKCRYNEGREHRHGGKKV